MSNPDKSDSKVQYLYSNFDNKKMNREQFLLLTGNMKDHRILYSACSRETMMGRCQLQRIDHLVDYEELSVTHIPSSSSEHKPYWHVPLIILGTHTRIGASGNPMAPVFDSLIERTKHVH